LNIEPDLIRAVFFDAGATLLHPDPPVEEIYAREFASDGARFSSEDFSRALTRAWEEVHARPAGDRYGGVRGERDFWHRFLNRVRATLDGGTVSGEVFARLAAHFRDAASWAIYEDVWPTLNALDDRGLPLAVVSNWDSNLPALLGDLGLSRRFREISVSAIEQTGKPHPEIFHRTCERLGVAPSQALHVGDSLSEDYEGAREAGLAALWLDRQESQAAMPDRICTLAQIVPWIDGHRRAGSRSPLSPSTPA
jgi:putative hydrolase of the HAD superfamily